MQVQTYIQTQSLVLTPRADLGWNISPEFARSILEAYEAIDAAADGWGGESARLARRAKLEAILVASDYRCLVRWAEVAGDPAHSAGASARLAGALRQLCRFF